MCFLQRTVALVAGIGLMLSSIVAAHAVIIIDSDGDTGTITGTTGGDALLLGVDGGVLRGVGNSKVFLTLNQSGGGTTEKGYNTDGTVEFQTIDSGTESLLLSEVPLVTYLDMTYRMFAYASNQTGWAPDISIEEIQLFEAATGNLSGYDTGARLLPGAYKIFDWQYIANDFIQVNDFVSGLKNAEMLLFIPSALFTDEYVYFYSSKGSNAAANNGPDKWLVDERLCALVDGCTLLPPQGGIPEPATVLLMGIGLAGLSFARRRRLNS